MKKKELTIDQAIELIERESERLRKPVLVAVCGSPNSGKTFLQWTAFNRLPRTCINASYDSPQAYAHTNFVDYLFIHAPVNTPGEVNEQTRKYLQRRIDFSVLIYNPRRESPSAHIKSLYDLVVRNPGAEIKSLCL